MAQRHAPAGTAGTGRPSPVYEPKKTFVRGQLGQNQRQPKVARHGLFAVDHRGRQENLFRISRLQKSGRRPTKLAMSGRILPTQGIVVIMRTVCYIFVGNFPVPNVSAQQ